MPNRGKYKNIIRIVKIETSANVTYVLFLLFWSPQRVLAIEVLEKSGRRGNRGCRITLRYFALQFSKVVILTRCANCLFIPVVTS